MAFLCGLYITQYNIPPPSHILMTKFYVFLWDPLMGGDSVFWGTPHGARAGVKFMSALIACECNESWLQGAECCQSGAGRAVLRHASRLVRQGARWRRRRAAFHFWRLGNCQNPTGIIPNFCLLFFGLGFCCLTGSPKWLNKELTFELVALRLF